MKMKKTKHSIKREKAKCTEGGSSREAVVKLDKLYLEQNILKMWKDHI